MIMQRRDLDPVRPQHAQDRIDLVCDKYEIAGDGGSAVPGWLKVDRGRRAHRRRSLHIAVHQPLGARKAVLEEDRKSTRRTPVTNAQLVCRLLLEKQKNYHRTK